MYLKYITGPKPKETTKLMWSSDLTKMTTIQGPVSHKVKMWLQLSYLVMNLDQSKWGGSNFHFILCCIDTAWSCYILLLFFLRVILLFYFIFKLYIIVLVLPKIKMNPPQVYMCSPSWTLLPPPSPYHPSGSFQCTSPKHPVSCIEPGLALLFAWRIRFSVLIIHWDDLMMDGVSELLISLPW